MLEFESLAVIEDHLDGWTTPSFESFNLYHISSCLCFLLHKEVVISRNLQRNASKRC